MLVIGDLVPVLGRGVVPGPVVADLKYLAGKSIGLPLSRARISPETRRLSPSLLRDGLRWCPRCGELCDTKAGLERTAPAGHPPRTATARHSPAYAGSHLGGLPVLHRAIGIA